jgi:hypothetical protein
VKHRRTIFHARVGLGNFHKKHVGTRYAERVFLHSVDLLVIYCISVHLGRETWMHYFSCSYGTGTDSTKSTPGHVMSNFCLCIRWDLWVTECISVCPRHETSTQYFSSSGGPGVVSIKIAPGQVMPNLCICIRGDLWVT